MSDSSASSRRARKRGATVPRAVIHKQILDVAESRPDAAMETIADAVSGATVSIVTNVLEEYGDPATTREESTDDEADTDETVTQSADAESIESGTTDREDAMTDHDTRSANGSDRPLEPAELTAKQRETLREIYERPAATQAELADHLGVSSATINQRVNAIDGFDWSNRTSFVESLFGSGIPDTDGDSPAAGAETALPDVRANGASANSDERGTDAERGASPDPNRSTDGPTPHKTDEDADRSSAEVRIDDTAGHDDEPRSVSDVSVEHLSEQIALLSDQLEAFEDRSVDESATTGKLALDPELAHKVMHACLSADHISEDEELRVLRALLSSTPMTSRYGLL